MANDQCLNVIIVEIWKYVEPWENELTVSSGMDAMTDIMLGRRLLDDVLESFGRALAIVVDILDPDVIVLGGGVSNLDVLYVTTAAHRLSRPETFAGALFRCETGFRGRPLATYAG